MASENPQISCQCGDVSFRASLPKPLGIFACHCNGCRKQSASAFGVTYSFPAEGMWPPPPALVEKMSMFTIRVDSGNLKECWFCRGCGVRIAHRSKLPDGTYKDPMSIKGGCVEGMTMEGARHVFTKNAIVPVPEGSDLAEPQKKG